MERHNGYDITFYPKWNDLSPEQRTTLLAKFDIVSDRIWSQYPHWVRQDPWLLSIEACCLHVEKEGKTVGYSIYQHVPLDDARVIYRVSTNVLPEHQEHGLYRVLTQRIIITEQQAAGSDPVYVSLRTQNPIVWAAHARRCITILPASDPRRANSKLLELGRRTVQHLFPGATLEVPSMILRGAYASLIYRAPQHHRDPAVDTMFHDNPAMTKADARFVIGKLRREGMA